MTVPSNITTSEKERVEHTARTTPPPLARKKKTAKHSRSNDQITRAPKKSGLSEAEERSILNDPLASKAAAPQNNEADLYTGSGFPPPGLAFYAAQAMSLAVQTDANAMNVYSNLEQTEYKLINTAYQQMADKDKASIESQASATMWGAISQTVMGGLTFGGGVYGAVRLGSLTKETAELNTTKNDFTNQIGKSATFDEDGKLEGLGHDLSSENLEEQAVRTGRFHAQDNFDHKIKLHNELKKFDADAAQKNNNENNNNNNNVNEWANKVNDKFDGLDGELANEREAYRQSRLDAGDTDLVAQEQTNFRFDPRENELNSNRAALLEQGHPLDEYEVEPVYKKREKTLTKNYTDEKKILNDKETSIKQKIEEIDTKLKAKKAKGQTIQSHITMAQGLGQLGQAFNFGKMASENSQAQQQYEKTEAQKAQTMNESVRGEVARQWSSLAQAKESAMQEYASTMKAINQSLRA